MKIYALAVILGFFLILLDVPLVHAQIRVVILLPELVQQADAVCIGTINYSTQKESLNTTQITVNQVLKGSLPTNISVFKSSADHTNLSIQHGIFFLNGDSKSAYWEIITSSPSAMVDLGDKLETTNIKSLTPLRAILLTMAEALPNLTAETRVDMLQRISEFYMVYQPKDARSQHLAEQLGETDGLPEFCKGQLLPLTMKYANDPNPLLRVSALRIAAMLQDETAMPKLRKLAEVGNASQLQQPEYTECAARYLAYFHTPHSVPFMLNALHSRFAQVRYYAMSSLVGTLHRDALPLLLDRVGTSDKLTQDSVIEWLSDVTQEMPVQGNDLGKGQEKKYVQYWKTWELAHQKEVQALRKKLPAEK